MHRSWACSPSCCWQERQCTPCPSLLCQGPACLAWWAQSSHGTYTHTHTWTVHENTHIHEPYMKTHTCTHTRTHARMHARMHACMHAHTHTWKHTHTHMNIHTHEHTHTLTRHLYPNAITKTRPAKFSQICGTDLNVLNSIEFFFSILNPMTDNLLWEMRVKGLQSSLWTDRLTKGRHFRLVSVSLPWAMIFVGFSNENYCLSCSNPQGVARYCVFHKRQRNSGRLLSPPPPTAFTAVCVSSFGGMRR